MSLDPLPPKTCSIDRLITRQEDIQKVLTGKKRATRRNGRYADPGEILLLKGESFRITAVYRQRLGEMTDRDAQSEGFENVHAYVDSIQQIHPRIPLTSDMPMWVHEFEPMGN
jgi:N4-acetylcytidine amidohydrolase